MLAGAEEDKARTKQAKAGFNSVVYEEEAKLTRLFSARVGTEVDAEPKAVAIPGYVSAFRVAPDGRHAVVDSAPTPQIDDAYTSKRAHVIDLTNGKVLRVVETPGKLGDIEISPDGTQLSMIAGVDMNDPADTTLHLVDVASGSYRALNAGAPEAAVDAEWLADGRLAAVIHKGAQSALRIYNADGSVAEEHDGGALILTGVEAGWHAGGRGQQPAAPGRTVRLERRRLPPVDAAQCLAVGNRLRRAARLHLHRARRAGSRGRADRAGRRRTARWRSADPQRSWRAGSA
jgi:Tol biopolymer transport system component